MLRERILRLLHLGYDYDVFSAYSDEVASTNLNSLRNLSLAGTAIGLVMLIFSLHPSSLINDMRIGYAIVAVAMGITYLCTRTVLKRHKHAVKYAWHFLLVCIFLGGTLISTALQPTSAAVTMIVFVVAVPLFCVERPLVIYCITGLMSFLFFVLSSVHKPPEVAEIDAVNIIVFYLCGVATYYQTVHAKMDDIVSRSQLCRQRDTDGLTGLNNRMYCETEINRFIRNGMDAAVFAMLDLDDFKSINDRYGHDVGDMALKGVTGVLRRSFRAQDIIGRLGGDEFIVFLPYCACTETLRRKIHTLIRDVSRIRLDGCDAFIGVSVGVACCPEAGTTFQELYKNADVALYAAKQGGKGRYAVYGDSRPVEECLPGEASEERRKRPAQPRPGE